jgi:hypothetical protein
VASITGLIIMVDRSLSQSLYIASADLGDVVDFELVRSYFEN